MSKHARTSVIVGASGQDGSLLKRDLEMKGVTVIGVSTSGLTLPDENDAAETHDFNILDPSKVEWLVATYQPDEVYYLAAYHGSSEGNYSDLVLGNYQKHANVHVYGLLNFLSAVQLHSNDTRLFYASSSLVFDGSAGPVQNEQTPFSPVGFYGLTKAQGMLLCRQFREHHGVFASSGILYNHESVLRANSFLSKKLIVGAHRISQGLQEEIVVGSLGAETDWGYAPDYVDAFQRVLQTDDPEDFVIASGESHSVREFADVVFECFSLNADNHLKEDLTLMGRKPVKKVGDNSRLIGVTGWKRSCDFRGMVRKLVADYLALQEAQK